LDHTWSTNLELKLVEQKLQELRSASNPISDETVLSSKKFQIERRIFRNKRAACKGKCVR
jgi:hypothetical protein